MICLNASGHFTILLPSTPGPALEATIAAIYSGHLTSEAKELLGGLGLLTNTQSNQLQVKLKEEKPEEQEVDGEDDYKDQGMFPDDVDLEYDGQTMDETFSDDDQDSNFSDFEEKPPKKRKKKPDSKSRRTNSSSDKSVFCKICEKYMSNASNYRLHMKIHEDREFPCDRCDKVFKRDLNLKMHIRTAHKDDEMILCKFCNERQCMSSSGLKRHQKNCESNLLQEMQCHVCNATLPDSHNLARHMETEHQQSKVEEEEDVARLTHCKFCNLEFSPPHDHDIEGHLKTCLKHVIKTLQCILCPVQAPTKDMLLEHLMSAHSVNPPPYSCLKPDCDHLAMNRKARSRHMREKHDIRPEQERIKGEAEFCCKFCPVANFFESEEKCRKHEETWHKVHCQEPDCDYTCESDYALQEHGAKAHGMKAPKIQAPQKDKTVFCELCGKRFANSSNLKEHMELHEDKEIRCDKCDKVFKRTLNLKMHMRAVHSDETFICQFCMKMLKNRRILRLHIAQYHEEKKYHCELCPKGFVTKSNLKQHIVSVHTKSTPYSCKHGCGRAYSDPSNCRQHERSVHEGNPRGPKQDRTLTMIQRNFSP